MLAVDAYGSGDSDYVKGVATNAGASDIDHESALIMDGGASTGLEQMMSWPFVDQDNIGLIGHSMGGTYIANAALSHADHVKAIMPWGSGSFVDMMRNHKSSDFPFDVGYINANSDEMVSFALKGKPNQLFDDESLKAFIGTDDPIEPGKTYGSFEDGTARVIYNPSTTHIGNIICKDSIKSIIDFFSEAIPTGSNLSSSNQVWMYKELFCILGIIALISFIVNYSMVLVLTPYFADIQNQTLPELKVNPDLGGMIPKIDDSPWPGFPPDLMSIMVVTATQVDGMVLIFEKMFESRMVFVDKLISMGARIISCDPHRAVVAGPSALHGEHLVSPDVRAGMAMVIAAMAAHGESRISNVYQIERGYENLVERLQELGAHIERVQVS